MVDPEAVAEATVEAGTGGTAAAAEAAATAVATAAGEGVLGRLGGSGKFDRFSSRDGVRITLNPNMAYTARPFIKGTGSLDEHEDGGGSGGVDDGGRGGVDDGGRGGVDGGGGGSKNNNVQPM